MKITDLFGKNLRDMHSFIGWLKENEPQKGSIIGGSRFKNRMAKAMTEEAYNISIVDKIKRAHTFLAQPMQESWFRRGEEPIKLLDEGSNYFEIRINPAWNKWNSWQPLFLGEWEIDNEFDDYKEVCFKNEAVGLLSNYHCLNDFADHCKKIDTPFPIPLELNDKYEI